MEPSVEIILEEYKALRAEIILCLERRVTIVSFGLTAIALLTTAAIQAFVNGDHKITSSIILLLGIVPASLFVLRVWLAETRRARRASYYIGGLELNLKNLKQPYLRWEHWIRKGEGQRGLFFDHYSTIVNWFFGVATVALVGAFIFVWRSRSYFGTGMVNLSLFWGYVFVIGVTAGSLVYLFFRARKEIKDLQKDYNEIPDINGDLEKN